MLKETARKRHSLPVECKGRDKPNHQKKPSEGRALTNCQVQMNGPSQDTKETKGERGTNKLPSVEGRQVKTPKEIRQARGTHRLSNAEGATSHDNEKT